ncbi:zinc finger transcription factor [Colletotrichum graminicola]|uniref:Zinc finger transcription factor n=1 Tax=Colletotrichum graminicola (strain M1.001 / M2 / FGSC 10212) TaxID=645133 RepID=E3QS50_COLGM|nr:zinc finger transcription factor [Colletotrichum graminicola M1.001]EFQ33688.1 zinc finger transcription factor [Colletotrichum graminicola M1.001]WDK10734.1 zinc finger transcription factor [Colletotrichum graminicola]
MKGRCCEYGMSMRTGERPRVVASPNVQREAGHTTPISSRDAPHSTIENYLTLRRMDHSSDPSAGAAQIHDVQDDIDWVLQATRLSNAGTPKFGPPNEQEDSVNQSYALLPTPSDLDYSFNNFNRDHGLQSLEQQQTTKDLSSGVDSRRSSSIDCDVFRSRVHDCTTKALMLVADFHVLAAGCLTAAQDPVVTFNLGSYTEDTQREMGTVLSENRMALKQLDNLLDCRCSTRQEVLVLIYLAVTKAVEWYAAVLGSDDDEASQEDDPVTPRMFRRITRTNSFMGSYSLDNDVQRVVRAHLVLTQLKDHVHPLLKKLRHRHLPTSASIAGDSSAPLTSGRRTSSVIEHLDLALSEELSRISAKANAIKQIC